MLDRLDNPSYRAVTIGRLTGLPPVEKRKPVEDDEPGTWQIIVHKRIEEQISLVIGWILHDIKTTLACFEVPLTPVRRHQFDVALLEGIVNAARHGNLGDPEKSITVQWGVDNTRTAVEVVIDDEGQGFPEEREYEIGSQHGRGVMIMRLAFDVEHHPGVGRVTLRKNILDLNADAR